MVEIAVFFHLGNFSLWNFFLPYILNVQRVAGSFDLYVTYQRTDSVLAEVQSVFPSVILIESINGCDIGGQLLMMKKAIELKKEYDYILKLHTKTNLSWRLDLIDCLCQSENDVRHVCSLFNSLPNVGMIGSSKWLLSLDRINSPLQETICDRLGLQYQGTTFIGGTIFWFRWKPMVKLIQSHNIDLYNEYLMMEPGYLINLEPTVTHSWERILGIMIYNAQLVLFGITDELRSSWMQHNQSVISPIEVKPIDPPVPPVPVVLPPVSVVPVPAVPVIPRKKMQPLGQRLYNSPSSDNKPRPMSAQQITEENNRLKHRRHGRVL